MQLNGERNYHIFYRLLAGMSASELAKLHLVPNPRKYDYLTKVREAAGLLFGAVNITSLPDLMYHALLTSHLYSRCQGNTVTCDIIHEHDGRDMGDKEYFAIIRGAMKVLNFTESEMWDIWRVVALIMHLGNISFGGV